LTQGEALDHGGLDQVAVHEEEGGQILINSAVLLEVEGSLFTVVQDLVAENILRLTEVLAVELVQQHPLDVGKLLQPRENGEVVDINGDEGRMTAIPMNVDAWVNWGWLEAVVVQMGVEFSIPLKWGLFDAVQTFLKSTDVVWVLFQVEPFWLLNEDLLHDGGLEEG
jgi:hypothetical protein